MEWNEKTKCTQEHIECSSDIQYLNDLIQRTVTLKWKRTLHSAHRKAPMRLAGVLIEFRCYFFGILYFLLVSAADLRVWPQVA